MKKWLRAVVRYFAALVKWPMESSKYIVPYDIVIPSPLGVFIIPKGFVFDGASGVPNLLKKACGAHDYLYRKPEVYDQIVYPSMPRRIDKDTCDRIYRWILHSVGFYIIGWVRDFGLDLFGHKAWEAYRMAEEMMDDPIAGCIIPHPDEWIYDEEGWEYSKLRRK